MIIIIRGPLWWGILLKVSNPRDKNPQIGNFSGIFRPQDFLLGVFRDPESPIPIPGMSNLRGFSNLAKNEKNSHLQSPSRGFGSPKNPFKSHL